TRWIETEFATQIPPYVPEADPAGDGARPGGAGERERIVVEVGGKRLEVVLPAGLGATAATAGGRAGAGPAERAGARQRSGRARAAGGKSGRLASPLQNTVVQNVAGEGQRGSPGGDPRARGSP